MTLWVPTDRRPAIPYGELWSNYCPWGYRGEELTDSAEVWRLTLKHSPNGMAIVGLVSLATLVADRDPRMDRRIFAATSHHRDDRRDLRGVQRPPLTCSTGWALGLEGVATNIRLKTRASIRPRVIQTRA